MDLGLPGILDRWAEKGEVSGTGRVANLIFLGLRNSWPMRGIERGATGEGDKEVEKQLSKSNERTQLSGT